MPDFKDYNHSLILRSFAFAAIAALLIGCTPEENKPSDTGDGDGGKTTEIAPSVTIEVNHVSAISAVLNGKALLEGASGVVEYGFAYSTSAAGMVANPTLLKSDAIDSDSNYSVQVSGLTPESTYYYRSYLYKDGNNYYGETKSFTTKEFSSLLTTQDATEVGASTATLNATLDLTDVPYSSNEYGFYLGISESSQDTKLEGGSITGTAYNAALSDLSHKTQYWYKAFVILDNQTFYGEVKTFTTSVVSVESVSLDFTEYTFHTIGDILSLNATILPADATDQSKEWSSNNADVATVDQSGNVTAIDNGIATITVTNKDESKTATCVVTVAQWVTSISLNKPSILLNEGKEETLTATVSPDNAADKTLIWSSSNESVATVDQGGKVTAKSIGNTTIKATANDGSEVFSSCNVTVKPALGPCPSGAVDLGLSVYWATSNLSASGLCANPQDYGDYYAWGEIDPYNDGTPYKFFNDQGITKYCPDDKTGSWGGEGAPDGKTVLDAADDAAYILLGGSWRMPTYDEVSELTKKCKVEWTSEKGVYGFRFTSRVNGNSIFLPAAGYWELTDLYADGIMGRYWSSSLDTGSGPSYQAGPRFAWSLAFNDDSNNAATHRQFRSLGLSIRPVSE